MDLNLQDEREQFALLYLDKFENKEINDSQYISYDDFVKIASETRKKINNDRAKYLIKKHFFLNLRESPIYRLFKFWVKLFFEYVSIFSNSDFFIANLLKEDHQILLSLQLNEVRAAFLDIRQV